MWLDEKNFEYQLIDTLKEPPLIYYLNLALEQYFSNIKRIFNVSGKAFRSIDIDIYGLSREEILKLLLVDGKLEKRTFLVY